MAFLLSDVKADLQALGYGTDTTAAQTTYIAELVRRIPGMRRWRWLEAQDTSKTVVAGVNTVDLASLSAREVDAVRVVDGTDILPLDFLPLQQLREQADSTDASQRGAPRYWTVTDGEPFLVLAPYADKTYTLHIDYIRRPAVPTADGNTIDLPDGFRDVLKWGAAQAIAARQRDWQGASFYSGEYNARLGELIVQDGFRQRQTSEQVERWPGWDDVAR